MRRYPLHLLTALAVAVALVLVFLWLQPDGSLRNSTWVAPEPQTADYNAMLPELPPVGSADTRRFLAMLERPVFSITRRPPPPPPPPETAQAPPPDHLSTARLSGIFFGDGVGGVIMQIAGKQRRAQLNELVEGWTLKAVQGRTVTFAKGSQQRVLTLERSLLQNAAGTNPTAGAAGTPARTGRAVGTPQIAPPTGASIPVPSAFTVPAPSPERPAVPAASPSPSNGTAGPAGSRPAPTSVAPSFGGS